MIGATDVFVSYKAQDRARLVQLVEALEAEGFAVWWDAKIAGGTNWQEDIEAHLESARCVIVAWSKRSVGQGGHFVRDEARRAQQRGSYLPIRLDDAEPPLGFGEIQAISLKGWHGDRSDARFRALADAAHRRVTGEISDSRPAPHKRSDVSRRVMIAGGGVLAVAGAGGVGWFLFRPAGARANTLAVLPFANLSGDPSQDYFADGIAEELRNALAASGALQVVARTSSEALRNVDAITAARRLHVENVVTGSVRRSSSKVRISAELVDGTDGLERWSQSFDRPVGDVLQIQSDIATEVAQALGNELGTSLQNLPVIGGTKNPAAQDYLLRARATEGDDSAVGMQQRVALLEQAIQLDPNYAEAHARKGLYQDLWANSFAKSYVEKDRAEAEAIRSVQRAIAIAPSMSLGHGALGLIYSNQLLMNRSLEELHKAADLPGADATTLTTLAFVSSQAGRQREAEILSDQGIKLDPLNPTAGWLQSWIFFFGRRYRTSIDASRRTLAIAPNNIGARSFLAWSLLMLGKTNEAVSELQKVPADNYRRLVGEGVIAARSGRKADALDAIRAIRRNLGDAANYQDAEIYAQLGMTDQAIQALDEAWSKRDSGLGSVRVDPFLDPIRTDPRLAKISARLFA
jgi:serine/threonine-protein kinase